MKIRNKSGATREIDVDGTTLVVDDGDEIEVPDDLAKGVPPDGKPGDLNYYPGTSGLLAQEAVWEAVEHGKSQAKGKSDDAPKDKDGDL